MSFLSPPAQTSDEEEAARDAEQGPFVSLCSRQLEKLAARGDIADSEKVAIFDRLMMNAQDQMAYYGPFSVVVPLRFQVRDVFAVVSSVC